MAEASGYRINYIDISGPIITLSLNDIEITRCPNVNLGIEEWVDAYFAAEKKEAATSSLVSEADEPLPLDTEKKSTNCLCFR